MSSRTMGGPRTIRWARWRAFTTTTPTINTTVTNFTFTNNIRRRRGQPWPAGPLRRQHHQQPVPPQSDRDELRVRQWRGQSRRRFRVRSATTSSSGRIESSIPIAVGAWKSLTPERSARVAEPSSATMSLPTIWPAMTSSRSSSISAASAMSARMSASTT